MPLRALVDCKRSQAVEPVSKHHSSKSKHEHTVCGCPFAAPVPTSQPCESPCEVLQAVAPCIIVSPAEDQLKLVLQCVCCCKQSVGSATASLRHLGVPDT